MKKALRVTGIIAVIILIFAAIISSMSVKPSVAEQVWDQATTRGSMEASNHFVVYSDIMCPYCVAFENAIIENEEAFDDYISSNDILFEIRMSDFLYEYGESSPINSRYSAVATFCAKNEGKFWDYYSLAIKTVWDEYYKNSGKSAFSDMNKLTKDYWIKLGKQVGLGETFENCVKNDETLDEVETTATRMAKTSSGMPSFRFNNYSASGFDLSWGWEYVLMMFDQGLKS